MMIELDRIYNADCLLGLKSIQDNSIDCVITDPPYELHNHGGGNSCMASRKLVKDRHIDFISNGFDYDVVFREFLRVCKVPNILCFCSNNQVSSIMSWFERNGLSTTLLVWHKTNPIPFANGKHLSDIEFIVYAHGHGSTFNNDVPLEYKSKLYTSSVVSNKNRLHPTQKGVEHIIRYIRTFTKENDIILDPFMGSGTTAVACIKERRHFIGFELSKEYFDKAVKRIKAEQQQLTLF